MIDTSSFGVEKKESECPADKQTNEQNPKEKLEKTLVANLLYLIHLFANTAQRVPRVAKVAAEIVGRAFLSTLFDLMLTVSPWIQIKILRVFQTLIQTKLPLEIFEQAIADCSSLETILKEGQHLEFC